MPLTFAKPPLIELIAELRWNALGVADGQAAPADTLPMIFGSSAEQEQFYLAFGGEVYQSGFRSVERLVPPGFPVPPFQAVCRYKNEATPHILQVGQGVFSANAIPPYRSWSDFRPSVEKGIKALLHTRPPSQSALSFSSTALRYIDLFGSNFIGKLTPGAFVRDVLGFDLSWPPSVGARMADPAQTSFTCVLNSELNNGMKLTISVGQGNAGGISGIIMDTNVALGDAVAPNEVEVLKVLDEAHKVIHEIFVGMTGKLHSLMEPTGAD